MLSGCASTAVRDPNITWRSSPLIMTYCIKSSSEISTIEKSLSDEENKNDFKKQVQISISDIHDYVEKNITRNPDIAIKYSPTCDDKNNHTNQTADFILTIDLSGYGSLKKEWKRVLIGTGIAEGIFQGLVVTAATQNPWLGTAVGAEEITSEYLTWNGVDWILGDAYAPVTLEGSLVYTNNKEVLWQDSAFITENEDALSDSDKKDKAKQLGASLHKAEAKLLVSLNKYLKTELVKNRKSPEEETKPEDW